MACANFDMDIQGEDEDESCVDLREPPKIQCYQATEMLPPHQMPLPNLMRKQPAVLGSLQVASGLVSVGLGIIFAATHTINSSLFTMFRVSHFTGLLFIAAGIVTNLLLKYPGLLLISFKINCSCIFMALVGMCLIVVDLARLTHGNEYLQMMVLELCLLVLEIVLSAVLCIWFAKEKRDKMP